MRKGVLNISFFIILLSVIFIQFNCVQEQKENTASKETNIERGKYLVNLGGCNDCHSPKVMTPNGPIPDTTKLLSGAPEMAKVAGFDPKMVSKGEWILSRGDLTAWAGPWGISFTANLTPDKETGLGSWTEERFVKALRTGKHLGEGRPILPPMPWPSIGQSTDQDLKDIFAYLQSLQPVKNKVPDPIAPDEVAKFVSEKK